MALDKVQLKQGIKNLLTEMETRSEDAKDDFAEELANLIDGYVRSIEIIYTTGLVAPPTGGPVTGLFEYEIQ